MSAPPACRPWPLALAAAVALGVGSAPAAQRPRLCIEHLPNVVYVDEPVTVCARVEAPGEGAATFRLTTWLLDAERYILDSTATDGRAEPGEPWRYQGTLRAGEDEPASLYVELEPEGGGEVLASVMVPVLDGREPLPPLSARGMRLVDARGRRVLVRIGHRVFTREQRWLFVRYVHRRIVGEGWKFDDVVFVGSDLGAPERGYLARLAASDAYRASVVAVPSEGEEAAPPILRAVGALSQASLEEEPDLAVLCLGHDEPDWGTGLTEFRRALELVVQQLEARGCSQFVLVAPCGPPHLAKPLARYAAVVRRVAFVYKAKFLDPREALEPGHWSAGQADGPLVLRHPNRRGHEALAETIARFLADIRR
ncbi:MAG: SGNH/GDSL hydrolase family protein [Candidatus Brocadiia bacterium]